MYNHSTNDYTLYYNVDLVIGVMLKETERLYYYI